MFINYLHFFFFAWIGKISICTFCCLGHFNSSFQIIETHLKQLPSVYFSVNSALPSSHTTVAEPALSTFLCVFCCLSLLYNFCFLFCSVQSLSHVRLFATPWTAACQASLSITNSQSPPKPMSFESVKPSNHLILCPPLSSCLPSFPAIRAFSNESVLRSRWPKCQSFSFSISLFYEYSGLISFRMDWLDLLAVQGTRKSLLQHHSSKASVLWHSAFFIIRLSHPYMTTGKTIALTRRTYVSKCFCF